LPLARLSAMPRYRRVASRPLGADLLTEYERDDDEEEGEGGPCSPES
jgi:diaminohydroxyphosphoribosylaminopyrimidine deaminase / 5-amino-6-(5-phosphoribosylamino)uracil reductase